MAVILKWRKLDTQAEVPDYMSDNASGMDLKVCLTDPAEYPAGMVFLQPGEVKALPTGLAVAIPADFELQIRPRSGLSLNTKLRIPNSPGTIDADYRGEIKIIVENIGQKDVVINHRERIAQAVLVYVYRAVNFCVEELNDTERSIGGFGSTGIK